MSLSSHLTFFIQKEGLNSSMLKISFRRIESSFKCSSWFFFFRCPITKSEFLSEEGRFRIFWLRGRTSETFSESEICRRRRSVDRLYWRQMFFPTATFPTAINLDALDWTLLSFIKPCMLDVLTLTFILFKNS